MFHSLIVALIATINNDINISRIAGREFLYESRSDLYRDDNNTSFGRGLKSRIGYNKGQHVVYFIGEFITMEQAAIRTQLGNGGYIIKVGNGNVDCLDCFGSAFLEDPTTRCLASLANSPLNAHTLVNNVRKHIDNNCELIYSRQNRTVRLRAKK